jgi:ribosomal protein S1
MVANKKEKQNKKTSNKEPQSMEELLEKTDYQLRGLQKGEEVEGTVTDITESAVLVDINAKTEGMVINSEFKKAEEFISRLEVGDTVTAEVTSPENEQGQILLSLQKAADKHKWELLEQYMETNKTIEVRGLRTNKGGLIARKFGIRGFIPASQFGRDYLGKINELQNKKVKVKIIEVDREKNRLIFSEKAVSEAEVIKKQKQALKEVEVGEVYEGIVSGVKPFGVFVRVIIEENEDQDNLFLEGLVHISEISWERVENVKNRFNVGERIKVKVIDVEDDDAKLNLSIKRLNPDPWDDIEEKYPEDKKVKGKITRLVAFGAFVELEPGIEGLIHISKIPADYDMNVGDEIEVYVESIDKEKRRMSLGLMLTEKPVGYK